MVKDKSGMRSRNTNPYSQMLELSNQIPANLSVPSLILKSETIKKIAGKENPYEKQMRLTVLKNLYTNLDSKRSAKKRTNLSIADEASNPFRSIQTPLKLMLKPANNESRRIQQKNIYGLTKKVNKNSNSVTQLRKNPTIEVKAS